MCGVKAVRLGIYGDSPDYGVSGEYTEVTHEVVDSLSESPSVLFPDCARHLEGVVGDIRFAPVLVPADDA